MEEKREEVVVQMTEQMRQKLHDIAQREGHSDEEQFLCFIREYLFDLEKNGLPEKIE